MVGKTRMAVRLIRDLFPNRGVVIPDSRDALASLDAADVDLRDLVIFLDDINRMIGTGGITDGTLRQLVAAGNVVIGTIRAAEYDRYQPTDQFRSPEWDVMSVFEPVVVSRELSAVEKDRLTSAVSDQELRQRITNTGLGEYVGGAERVRDVLRTGQSANPAGYALVQGAADWQRAGLQAPVPAAVLRELGAPHLSSRHSADLLDGSVYNDALLWATRDINPTVALLQREGAGHFVVFDYALDLLTRQGEPIPDQTWPILIKYAEPIELILIGYEARVRRGKPELALQAWRAASDSGDPNQAPGADFNLGLLCTEQGDIDGAKAAYQRTIDSGHPVHAPNAAFNLGNLLMNQGDLEGAQRAYGPAIHVNVAVLLEKRGDIDAARAFYQRVIESGRPDQAPKAAVNLGMLCAGQGDVDGAKAAYKLAIDSGHYDEAPRGAFALGRMLQQQGEVNAAKAAYQLAIDSGHPKHAPAALHALGKLPRRSGYYVTQQARPFFQDLSPEDIESIATHALELLSRGEIDSGVRSTAKDVGYY
jgi:tetratricopeptide (TPR) repeat protein